MSVDRRVFRDNHEGWTPRAIQQGWDGLQSSPYGYPQNQESQGSELRGAAEWDESMVSLSSLLSHFLDLSSTLKIIIPQLSQSVLSCFSKGK